MVKINDDFPCSLRIVNAQSESKMNIQPTYICETLYIEGEIYVDVFSLDKHQTDEPFRHEPFTEN